MKLKNNFIVHDTGNEQILVSAGNTKFNGLVRSNKTAALIVNCLKNDTTEAEILSVILNKYDVSEEIAKTDLTKILNTLREIGALDE